MKTWGLRAAGWALMFLSIQLTMRIIYTLGKHALLLNIHIIPSPSLHLSLIMLCAYSGLGSYSQRACVRGAEDLRLVRLLLSVSSHHRSWLVFLQAVGGCGSGSTSFASSVSRPLRTSS